MEKKKRLFIAINLPEQLKNNIEKEMDKIRQRFSGEVRFIDRRQWHLTITFLGYQPDERIYLIAKSMREISERFAPPEIEFTNFSYGPKEGPKRMIWLNGGAKTSEQLGKLKEELENKLMDYGVIFKKERQKFQTHITLARFSFKGDLPEIAADFKFNFSAAKLDLMESHLKRSGAEYEILQSVKFSL